MATKDKAQAPDINAMFADLAIEESSEPLPPPTRGTQSGPNPFTERLKTSVSNDTAQTFYIPAVAVKRAVFLINAAARKENVGVRIIVNTRKDEDGKMAKDATGKAIYQPETTGPNKGKVMVRFQGLKERKQQKAPRPYSIVLDKSDASGNTYMVRRREDKAIVFKGTKDECKAKYEALKTEVVSAPPATEAPAVESPTEDANAAA